MNRIYSLTSIFILSSNLIGAQIIWTGPDFTFTKEAYADWTLPANQDIITPNVILTRQENSYVYNYQYWQSNFGTDPDYNTDLCYDFYNGTNISFFGCSNPILEFTPTGGTKGLRWCILDDTGSTRNWNFSLYGTLGNPQNFFSFHNIATIIKSLEEGTYVYFVDNDFSINVGDDTVDMPLLIGKKLGVWIVDEDIYFTLTFNTWSNDEPWYTGGSGGILSYTRSTNQFLSTDEVTVKDKVKLFPNPSSHFVKISGLNKTEKYTLYTVLGVEVKNGIISDNEKINIQNLSNGMYFLKFNNRNTLKFIKE
jgi:hypothetical protein